MNTSATDHIDNVFYNGFRTSMEYSSMVKIVSFLVPLVAAIMHVLLKESMRAAQRGDVCQGRDITFRSGPDEIVLETWMLIKAKQWSKLRRGISHVLVFTWIFLLPILLLQFGSWKRFSCSSEVLIIDTAGQSSDDWFNSTSFNQEQRARLSLTFRHNHGIGMATNATGGEGLIGSGQPGNLSVPEVYSFRQCLYWTGELYKGCESGQEIRETYNSAIRVVPVLFNSRDERSRNLKRKNLPYTQELTYYEQQAPWAESSIRCARTFEIESWVCTYKSENAWHVADITSKNPEDGQFVNIPALRLEGISIEEGEWAWFATTLAAQINAGGWTIHNTVDARAMAMLYAKIDFLLHNVAKSCKVVQKESFVISYIWIAFLAMATVLSLFMVCSMHKHRNVVHVPMTGVEWYMYSARVVAGQDEGLCGKRPSTSYYHKRFGLSKGNGELQHLSWNEELHSNQGEKILGIGSPQTRHNYNSI